MENNKAFVAFLRNITPIAGADKIVSADVMLNNIKLTQVVVGKDTPDNLKVVYFDSNLALSDEFITAIDKLAPDYGTEEFKGIGTYLAKGNRVRTIKLKGTISNGLAIEVDKFIKAIHPDKDIYVEGFSFTELNGFEVCHKWLPPVKHTNTSNKKGKTATESRMVPGMFHFHVDTDQLPRNMHKINPDQIISISRKVHGTSAIASYCIVKRKLSVKDKIAKFLRIPVIETEWDHLYASRTVIKNETTSPGFYGTDLWTKVGKENFEGKLHCGETVYYEIIGYIPGTETMIQKGYRYGCNKGEYKIAVYRITQTNVEGIVTEYGWQAMKQRCAELGVPMVEEYYVGEASSWSDLNGDFYETNEEWKQKFLQGLKDTYLEKKAVDCDNNPDEGVVVRIEGLNIEVYKLKSESFILKDSANKEADVVDIEDEEQAMEA